VVNWLHVPNEYEAVRYVMGEEAFDADSLNIVKDRVRKVLFGTGVSRGRGHPAAPDARRERLQCLQDRRLHRDSNLFKCKMFANSRAPLDVIGTGSSSRRTSTTLSPLPTFSCMTASRGSS